MKKVDLQFIQEGVRKLGAVKSFFEHIQAAYIESVAEIVKGLLGGTTTPVAIYGCVNSGSGGNYNISAGSIWHNGEVFPIPAFVGTASGGQVPVLNLSEVKTPLSYTDNTVHDTLVTRTYQWVFGASGSGLGNFSDLSVLATIINNTVLDVDGQLSLKAPLASPALSGVPTAPTAAVGTNTIQIATTAHVKASIDALIGGAPGALDTLNELAAALNDDASYAASITAALALKAPLASPALSGVPTAPTASVGTNSAQIATAALVKNTADLKSDKAQPNWISLSTVNGWTMFTNLRYRITDQNKLEIAGKIATGSASSPVFANLPNGTLPTIQDVSGLVINITDQVAVRLAVSGGSPTTLQIIGYASGKTYELACSIALDAAD